MAVKKDVSVIVLTYNSENTIKKCRKSVLTMQYLRLSAFLYTGNA